MRKMTFTLDTETARHLDTLADLLDTSKSEVVRDAVREYAERIGRLSEKERRRMLRVMDEILPHIPARPVEEVEEELAGIREARRSGGRRNTTEVSG